MLEMIGNDFASMEKGQSGVWIRPAGMGAGKRDQIQAAFFRLELDVHRTVEKAVIHISAADRYRLYVNGKSVCAGPLKGDQWNHYYETVNLKDFIVPGKNSITAHVISYAHFNLANNQYAPLSVYVSDTGIAFFAEGSIRMDSGEELSLSTREALWTAVGDPSVEIDNTGAAYVGYTETRDLHKEPIGWRSGENLGWEPAVPYFETGINRTGEITPLQLKARPIPNMYEENRTFQREMPLAQAENNFTFLEGPAIIPPHSHGTVVLDARELSTAYLQMKARGEGAVVTVTYAERYFPIDEDQPKGPMRRDDWEHGEITGQKDVIRLASTDRLFENFWYRTFRFVRIDVETGESPAVLEKPYFIQTGYPLDIKASLGLEDPRMEQLWQIALRTLQRCMHETHEDCPYYEQLQYTLDTRLQMYFTYAVSGDTRMARSVLWNFHCSLLPDGILQSRYPSSRHQVIPAFAIHWIYMLEDYLIQTGDRELIRFYRPTIDAVLHYFEHHLNQQGLVEGLGYWDFCDWVAQWDRHSGVPDAVWQGPSTIHNLTYALGLQTAARLMEACNSPGWADEYRCRSQELIKAIRLHCFDKDRGLLREGPEFQQYSQHAQSLGVLTGLLEGEEATRAMKAAMEDKTVLACTFPWQFTLFRALDKVGLYSLTAPIWQTYFEMLDRHLTTIPERPGDTRSDCHAWSALPLGEFVRMLLGVQPEGIGWERIRIAPHSVITSHMEGTVPTPKGDVTVKWAVENGKMAITADTPSVPVEVVLPNGKRTVFDGGHIEIHE